MPDTDTESKSITAPPLYREVRVRLRFPTSEVSMLPEYTGPLNVNVIAGEVSARPSPTRGYTESSANVMLSTASGSAVSASKSRAKSRLTSSPLGPDTVAAVSVRPELITSTIESVGMKEPDGGWRPK